MPLYSKKLHVRKNGEIIDINLYTTLNEVGNPAFAVLDGSTTVYAKLGTTDSRLASPLRVRKQGNIYAVQTAVPEPIASNLYAYTIASEDFGSGSAGIIYGNKNMSPATFTVQSKKMANLSGISAAFNFYQGNESRLVISSSNIIIDPFASTWTPLASPSWSNIYNLHAVATRGRWLYAIDYEQGGITVADMNNGYQAAYNYQIPASWSAMSLPSEAQYHGECLTVVGNDLYALFSVNPKGVYGSYSDSIVIKLTSNPTTGALSYVKHLVISKHAVTLKHFNNKLYICCIGGMQLAGSSNTDTRLDIVDLPTFTKTTVSTAAGMDGDFRSITIADKDHVYIFIGHYDSQYYNMVGRVYYTTIANIPLPSQWYPVINVNEPGVFWGVYNDSNHLWFVKGRSIEVFNSLPTTFASPVKSFSLAELGFERGNINSFEYVIPPLS